MEKAFAYICTAADTAPRLLKRYCRKVYELGYMKRGIFTILPARS